MGQSKIDAMVGNEPEDIVREKIYGATPEQDVAAEKVSHDGGTAKLPSNIKPFSLKGGE